MTCEDPNTILPNFHSCLFEVIAVAEDTQLILNDEAEDDDNNTQDTVIQLFSTFFSHTFIRSSVIAVLKSAAVTITTVTKNTVFVFYVLVVFFLRIFHWESLNLISKKLNPKKKRKKNNKKLFPGTKK